MSLAATVTYHRIILISRGKTAQGPASRQSFAALATSQCLAGKKGARLRPLLGVSTLQPSFASRGPNVGFQVPRGRTEHPPRAKSESTLPIRGILRSAAGDDDARAERLLTDLESNGRKAVGR